MSDMYSNYTQYTITGHILLIMKHILLIRTPLVDDYENYVDYDIFLRFLPTFPLRFRYVLNGNVTNYVSFLYVSPNYVFLRMFRIF